MTPEKRARLTRFRQELHQFPEISGEEIQTAARIESLMRELGADEVVTGLGGHGLAAVFDSGKPGPVAAIRCELDALPITEIRDAPYRSRVPGKGHLCGHDGHMTMAVAVAEALAGKRPLRGRAVVIFQPAEETGKGAPAYCADPRFRALALDYVFSLHNLPGLPLGHVEICERAANCASCGMRVQLAGRTSHAAEPQDGLSPAGAVAALMPRLSELGQGGDLDDHFALTTLTHVELGARSFGIAPGEAEIWVTLRTVTDERMLKLIEEAETLVRLAAQADGLRFEITYHDVFDACENAAEAVACLEAACEAHQIPVRRCVRPQKFSEDFGRFGKHARAAMFWLGAGEQHPQLHNPDYDFPDDLIPVGAAIFDTALREVLS